MVKKKGKLSKASKKKGSRHLEDVKVHTDLPPQVDGQLRCFCCLTINQVVWLVSPHPEVLHIRFKWWGEAGDGSLFRPVDAKKGDKEFAKTIARYPVRSGPKQFASYLSDMRCLTLEMLGGPSFIPVGRAEVPHISLLSPAKPINGYFPAFSFDEKKIAELQVSLVLEALMDSYDSMGSIPTTDVSMGQQYNTNDSMNPAPTLPVPHALPPRFSAEDPFMSPNAPQEKKGSQTGLAELEAKIRQKLNYGLATQLPDSQHTVAITTSGDIIRTKIASNDQIPSRQPNITDIPISKTVAATMETQKVTNDLLSGLLKKGNKLREAMIVSSLNSDSIHTSLEDSRPVTVPITDLPGVAKSGMSGSFLSDILSADKGDMSDIEGRTLDLLNLPATDQELQMLRALDGTLRSSISCDDVDSDLGDPLHDESILNELFYKHGEPLIVSDGGDICVTSDDEPARNSKLNSTCGSMEDPGNVRPPSRRSSLSSSGLPELDFISLKKSVKKIKKGTKKKPRSRKNSLSDRSDVETSIRTPKSKLPTSNSLKKKTSKKKVKARRGSVSDRSDSELVSTPRSEISRVSFDPCPSDLEEPVRDVDRPRKRKNSLDSLSVERLTLLGRVHVARVIVDSLTIKLPEDNGDKLAASKKVKAKGKPPRPSPKLTRACTYFIEYQFPVVATSRDKHAPNAMATEVVRVASKNVKDNLVTFHHRTVFPVLFDGAAVEKWCQSALVFKVYSRNPSQRIPVLLGTCGIPLKAILSSDSLHIEQQMEVRDGNNGFAAPLADKYSSVKSAMKGTLLVSVELASDSHDFPLALAKTKLAEMGGQARMIPIARHPEPAPRPPINPRLAENKTSLPARKEPEVQKYSMSSHGTQTETRNDTILLAPEQCIANQQPSIAAVIRDYQDTMNVVNYEGLTLHTILLIPDGRNISMQGSAPLHVPTKRPHTVPRPVLKNIVTGMRDVSTRNTYLVCRMFWCDDAVNSSVCWGSSEPQFNFVQVAPVLITQSLLERVRNNFMVVEVWDKKTSAQNDKLIGIVKLSLHQFYMSFRDRKIAAALMKSQYPVISVDNYLPIVDPFTGTQFGQIKVLLGMGSVEQVAALQHLKVDGQSFPERPEHYLERSDIATKGNLDTRKLMTNEMVDHSFEIVIEGVRGLQLFDNMIWGEADCFVQYHFPVQVETRPPGAPVIMHANPSMTTYRTSTTLCIPDPTFQDATRHKFMLPIGTPVQRELLTACSGSGGGAGGILFEIWCRHYHPNVRDQIIAKASLPLAKLCAMVTMKKRQEPSIQTFSLPLSVVESDAAPSDGDFKPKQFGLLDVTINYKSQSAQTESSIAAVTKNMWGAQVCIACSVNRATGLKDAAEKAARLDTGMQYPAEVGVNAYVKIQLSFLEKGETRVTRTVARSFCPEFSHHVDFPCPLIWTDTDGLALAEVLETAEVKLELWHQVPSLTTDVDAALGKDVSGQTWISKTGDVLLGLTTVPLKNLLTNKTGISGWFPLQAPLVAWQKTREADIENAPQNSLERIVGGLELSIKFAHHDDLDRVISMAKSLGWSPLDLDIEPEDWESEDEDGRKAHLLSIELEEAGFPLENVLRTNQSTLYEPLTCYVRYKFYDQGATLSKPSDVGNSSSTNNLVAKLKHKKDFKMPSSSPFKWYLREEKLEVQLWARYGGKSRHHDRLVGSAHIALESLSDTRRKQHRISGVYYLFKAGLSTLGGAYIRAKVTMKVKCGISPQKSQASPANRVHHRHLPSSDDETDEFGMDPMSKGSPLMEDDDVTPSFAVTIVIERAMHLPHLTDKQRSEEQLPNTYVSYQSSEKSKQCHTSVVHNTDCPVWDYQHETRLNTELLFQEEKNLIFKVWHKSESAPSQPDRSSDRVLGFVSVDLLPLTTGLRQICGWYNIADFSGQCKGQIKVSVAPLEPVNQYRGGILDPTVKPVGPTASYSSSSTSFLQVMPLPHFTEHYQNVKCHHEQLHNHLLDDQRPASDGLPRTTHWNPTFNTVNPADDTSRSILFSSLRQQMHELDQINQKMKEKLASGKTIEPIQAPIDNELPPVMSSNMEYTHLEPVLKPPLPLTVHPYSENLISSQLDSEDNEDLKLSSQILSNDIETARAENCTNDTSQWLSFVDSNKSGTSEIVQSSEELHHRNSNASSVSDRNDDDNVVAHLHQPIDGDESDEDDENIVDVVIPKSLNDISSANFNNYFDNSFGKDPNFMSKNSLQFETTNISIAVEPLDDEGVENISHPQEMYFEKDSWLPDSDEESDALLKESFQNEVVFDKHTQDQEDYISEGEKHRDDKQQDGEIEVNVLSPESEIMDKPGTEMNYGGHINIEEDLHCRSDSSVHANHSGIGELDTLFHFSNFQGQRSVASNSSVESYPRMYANRPVNDCQESDTAGLHVEPLHFPVEDFGSDRSSPVNLEQEFVLSEKGHNSNSQDRLTEEPVISSRSRSTVKSLMEEQPQLSVRSQTSVSSEASRQKSIMPNFFLPAGDLAESMRALQVATSTFPHQSETAGQDQLIDQARLQEAGKTAQEMLQKLGTSRMRQPKVTTVSAKGRQLPTAEETKRIARIFSSKFRS